MFSLLIPTGDGEQQTMVIWMERERKKREGKKNLWVEGRDEKDKAEEERKGEERFSVSSEGGLNKSVTVGMKTHSHSTFPEVSAIR